MVCCVRAALITRRTSVMLDPAVLALGPVIGVGVVGGEVAEDVLIHRVFEAIERGRVFEGEGVGFAEDLGEDAFV